MLADPKSPYTIMNDGYCGDGGIPGFIMGWLIPTEENIKRLPVALAHETNHNVRYQFIKWTNDVNVAEMIVSEGLAEMRQFPKVGLPYCAGYATGYYLVKYYLEKTGMPIEKATILPADEVLGEVPGFWEM